MDVAKSLRANSDDLWVAAVGTLGDELTSQIDFHQGTKANALDEMLAQTEQARVGLVDKSWSFERKNGQKVIVRDVLTKVAKWIHHFKEVGDVVAQYDPAHASLPWAGVRFLLTAAVGDLETYNKLLENIAYIAERICRNALVESLMGDSSSTAADELRRALVKLYASILEYLIKARAFYKQSTAKRILKHGLLASTELDSAFLAIAEAQKDVDNYDRIFNSQAQLEKQEEIKSLLKDLNRPVNRSIHALDSITDQLDVARRSKILSWISEEPYKEHHIQTNSEVLEGTGKWLLQDSTFQQWKNDSASSILWLHGIPGSGKSKLTSIVVEDAQASFEQQLAPAPVYFYCSRNAFEPGRSDPVKIGASIARQLSTPHVGGPLLEATVDMFQQRETENFAEGSLRLSEIKSLILRLLERYKNATMTMVIDALDECNEATRGDLLNMLGDILNASPCLLKIFVSSRDDQDIVSKLDRYPNLEISSNRNSEDINLFIRRETYRLVSNGDLLRRSTRTAELRDKIIYELQSKAHGMFRWASLQLQALQRCRKDESILERLGRLPRTLAESYQEIISRIDSYEAESDKRIAKTALSWLLCGEKQFQSHDFLAAVSTTEDPSAPVLQQDVLLDLCCNFVVFDSPLDVFRFAHLSVAEFLEAQEAFKPTFANALVAKACLQQVMNMGTKIALSTRLQQYSCCFWPVHAQSAGEQRKPQLGKLLSKFLSAEQDSSSCFYRWSKNVEQHLRAGGGILKLYDSISSMPSVLLVVCAFDLHGHLSPDQWKTLAREKPINLVGRTHQEVAILRGSSQILQWICKFEIHFQFAEEVIEAVARRRIGNKAVIEVLLDEHRDKIRITEGLIKEVARHQNKEVMERLLGQRGDEILITERIIKAAAENQKDSRVLELLLNQHGDEFQITEDIVKAVVKHGWSSEKMMALLLEKRGGEINVTEGIVKAAAENQGSGEKILALLLEKRGGEIHVTEGIVKAAAENQGSGEKIMALLLEKCGSEIHITEGIIRAAVQNGGTAVIELLLERRGNEIRITEDIIKAAIEDWRNTMEMLELLLEKRGDEIHVTEGIVKAAAMNNNPKVMELLLERSGDEIYITEGIIKASVGNWTSGEKMIKVLLEKYGDQIHITEDIIKVAARDGNPEVMELLLEGRGNEIRISDDIIKIAAEYNESAMAILLEKSGEEIYITDDIIKTAARDGNPKVMELLLDRRGNEIRITENIVKVAASKPDPGMMELLLERRGNAIRITEDIVKIAAEHSEAVMVLLLEKRGDEIQITKDIVTTAATGDSVSVLMRIRKNDTISSITDKACLAAAACGNLHALRQLCEHIPPSKIDQRWQSIARLYRAAKDGNVHQIKQLLKEPIPLNQKDRRGCTPLWYAVCYGRTEVVEILAREKKIDVNSLSKTGQSPIFKAASSGNQEMVDILIRAGAKTYFVDEDGETAVSMARKGGHEHIVKALLDAQLAERESSPTVLLCTVITALTLLRFIIVGALLGF